MALPSKSDSPNKNAPSPFRSPAANLMRVDNDKRRFYRVLRTSNPPLTVTLEQAPGTCLFAECDDISMGGAGVHFSATRDPHLSVGTEVVLAFQAMSRPDAIRARAKVVSVREQPDKSVRYGFQFTNQPELYAQMDSYYARYFNRREHMRVLPDHSEKIVAQLRWAKGEIVARVHDVSIGGLGLLIPIDAAAALTDVKALHVSVQLPNTQQELRLNCNVRSCRPLVKQALLGVEFEKDATLERISYVIARYVDNQLARAQQYNALAAPRRVT